MFRNHRVQIHPELTRRSPLVWTVTPALYFDRIVPDRRPLASCVRLGHRTVCGTSPSAVSFVSGLVVSTWNRQG